MTSIGGVGSFGYDDNGNQTSAPGRTTSWTSYDMPLRMTKGSVVQNYVYGPEHQRVRMDRTDDGTALVYAGGQEVELSAGKVTAVRTYWPSGIGMEADKPGQATELVWIHTDRLGSVIGYTDASGNLKERLGYDAWGKRRTTDGSATPDTLDGQVDHRGFTGHEMLDQLDLVHMNGRVYDPLIGRFLSADPLIQEPTNGQSYNRYTYVFNNATNLTDPTGFASNPVKDPQYKADLNCGASVLGLACHQAQKILQGVLDMAGVGSGSSTAPAQSEGKASKNPGATAQIVSANNGGSSLNSDPWRGSVQTFQEFGPNSAGTSLRRIKSPSYAEAEVGTMFQIAAFGATAGVPIEAGIVGAYRGVQAWRAGQAARATGTVWDSVKATQAVWPGTIIPRSFELTAGNSKVWVHGNATEHLAEYAAALSAKGVSSELVNIGAQTQLRSLQAAVQAASAGGLPLGKIVNVGGWELKFAAPRSADQLPALIHALPVR